LLYLFFFKEKKKRMPLQSGLKNRKQYKRICRYKSQLVLLALLFLNKKTMTINIINKSQHALPNYETIASAGMDLRANLSESITLKPLGRAIVKTGLFIELPIGYEAQVRPRSGLAAKNGITVLNAPGTVDADYRGEIGVILVNLSNEDFVIQNGERIAQLIIAKHERAEWIEVQELTETSRGEGGFGSTGVK
jgi:dUTP pyrophosphatase